ncbi:unnamed protein product [Linum trigynum]|uniref:Uncharacterized protein n=1 Tax=Linum trigynum TaxID=586398 RepID=A0AAV2D6A9_9ROSI
MSRGDKRIARAKAVDFGDFLEDAEVLGLAHGLLDLLGDSRSPPLVLGGNEQGRVRGDAEEQWGFLKRISPPDRYLDLYPYQTLPHPPPLKLETESA